MLYMVKTNYNNKQSLLEYNDVVNKTINMLTCFMVFIYNKIKMCL